VAAGPARAHLVSTELGPFYDGAAHPLVTPEDLLLILGLAVLAAFRGVAAGRRTLTSLALGWTVGVLAGFAVAGGELAVPYASAVLLVLVGLAGALRRRPPAGLMGGLAGVIGLARGFLNGAAAHEADGVWLSALGIATGVFLAAALALGLAAVVERRGWTVVLRVAASWIAAIGLLMLGWELQTILT
jgi:hydrogenase/urease accessory protein HupE